MIARSLLALALLAGSIGSGKTVVFWQPGFPATESETPTRHALEQALASDQLVFADIRQIDNAETFRGADLLVLPYGSAFPENAWQSILAYLHGGGNLFVLGGRPFRVPVTGNNGQFTARRPEEAYSRELGIVHSYQVPQTDEKDFTWKLGYDFFPSVRVQAEKYFVLEGRVDGLGYMLNEARDPVAAPVVLSQHIGETSGGMLGSRWIFLDFEPKTGYWDSPDGISLIHTAAEYAKAGATSFWIETSAAAIRPDETLRVVVHLRNALKEREQQPQSGEVKIDLLSGDSVIATEQVPCFGLEVDREVDFARKLPAGFYRVRGIYSDGGQAREFYQNGFWVEDPGTLDSGPTLGVSGDFLTENSKPFFPFGTNYFTTEENGWDFSGPRNADVWERDFADMERHGVTFVRTGVWGGQIKFIEGPEGGVSERFLRNLEGYLLCAKRHHIAVNFTFFAFDPQSTLRANGDAPLTMLPGGNPYLDPVTIRAEQDYMLAILDRFKNVPFLSWDLINEPSFSNPHHLWRGNTPNRDPAELVAWRQWLARKYRSIDVLAEAWSVTSDQLQNFDAIPLPSEHDLQSDLEGGNAGQVRAVDYNLFAQEMFSGWVKKMVAFVRSTGSKQLIDVGQDEGGVTNRVLNQFYGSAGLSFTTNHTYRQNQALLWDSLAAKVPGVPNIVGETGYQPNILPNGKWQFDEISGFPLLERKWAEGFAGGTSGALSWDWAREIYFGMKRSDGSDKIWIEMMHHMGDFAEKAGPYASGLIQPDVAIVLPHSLQLSTLGYLSIEAQQNAVRALYGYARSEAYMVGENQIAEIGYPKLIILPSPWLLSQTAWEAILDKVKGGATLLVSGRFDLNSHFEPTDRQNEIGIPYTPGLLSIRDNELQWPGGAARLIYGNNKTNYLERAFLPDGKTFIEKQVGNGRVLFSALPLELNEDLRPVGGVYRYALQMAGVTPWYSTEVTDAGTIICPTRFPHATLYVLTSQTAEPQVSFVDERSKKKFSGRLEPGRAALLLIGENGDVVASYNWNAPATRSSPSPVREDDRSPVQ